MHDGYSTSDCISVLVADTQPIFRIGLIALLASAHTNWDLIESHSTEDTRLRQPERSIDILIADARLLGVELDRNNPPQLRANLARHIIAITEPGDALGALGCLAAGAHATVSRSDPANRVLATIETTIARGRHSGAPASSARGSDDQDPLNLTSRQLDVLRLLAKGQSNKVIARDLGLSVSTVKVHLNTVFRALGASNRVEAVVRARPLQARMATQNQ